MPRAEKARPILGDRVGRQQLGSRVKGQAFEGLRFGECERAGEEERQ